MKLTHIITSIVFSSALMGCQIEMTPLEEDTLSGSVTVTENSTTTAETTTIDNTAAVTETTDTAVNQDSNTGSAATDTASTTGTDTGSDTAATDETSTTTDSSATDNTVNAATLYWSAPLVRTNNATLSFSEIGGYEIRYKLPADVEYNSVIINDASVEQYSFDTLENVEAYSFEVAAFDVNGIYSEFVAAN